MAIIAGSNVAGTAFAPSAGEFTITVIGGMVQLDHQAGGTGSWCPVEVLGPGMYVAKQVESGANWRFT